MRYLKTDRLYCFSPLVMLITFLIEIVCAVYVLWRYKLTPVTRIAALILVGLATFQLAEYNVCEGAWGVDSLTWAKIGYVAITLLPPLGIHLATRLAGQSRPVLIGLSYGAALVFSIFFIFSGYGIQTQQCLGNYVIFETAPWAVGPYALYYYGLLFMGVGYAWKAGGVMKTKSSVTRFTRLQLDIWHLLFPPRLSTSSILRRLQASHRLCVGSRFCLPWF